MLRVIDAVLPYLSSFSAGLILFLAHRQIVGALLAVVQTNAPSHTTILPAYPRPILYNRSVC